MSKLKCGAEKCVYNAERLCCKGEICIGGRHAENSGQTCCESFAERREESGGFTSSIAHPSEHVSIDCEAVKCIYNQDYKCTASHVDVGGVRAAESGETRCETFREA